MGAQASPVGASQVHGGQAARARAARGGGGRLARLAPSWEPGVEEEEDKEEEAGSSVRQEKEP